MQFFFALLPRREDVEEICNSSSCKKRWYPLLCDLHANFFLLAGHGGDGGKEESFVEATGGGWFGEFMESVLPVAVPQWRLRLTAAILDQKAGHATLGSFCCSRFIFLLRRIFMLLSAASYAPALPSGRVPSGSSCGRNWRWFTVGEFGSDCVFATFLRVICAEVLGRVVIFYFM
jgi:hypothetical protein